MYIYQADVWCGRCGRQLRRDLGGVSGSAEPQDEQDPDPESLEGRIAQPSAREPEGSICDRIPDDMHDDEDESAGHVH